jgi:hypothetical protein
MAQKSTTVSKALETAKEQDQDVFLASLNKEQLERTGFDTSTFGPFEYVDIYVLWDNDTDQYVLKYVFDGDITQTYYERARDLGEDYLIHLVEIYLSFGGDSSDN